MSKHPGELVNRIIRENLGMFEVKAVRQNIIMERYPKELPSDFSVHVSRDSRKKYNYNNRSGQGLNVLLISSLHDQSVRILCILTRRFSFYDIPAPAALYP